MSPLALYVTVIAVVGLWAMLFGFYSWTEHWGPTLCVGGMVVCASLSLALIVDLTSQT